jgi:TonB family protein
MTHLGPALRRAKVRESPRVRLLVALVLSLGLNALGAWVLHATGALTPPASAPAARVALAPIDGAAWEANRKVDPEQQHRGTVVELPPEENEPDQPDVAPEEPEATPSRARFLAERDQSVKKETVSRFAGNYPRLAAEPQLAVPGREGSGQDGRNERAAKGAEGTRGDPLALVPTPFGGSAHGEGGDAGSRVRGKLTPDLSLGAGTAAKVLAGPNFDGYREGIEEGDATHLNTFSFRYATYFNRMRNELREEFVPLLRDAVRDRDPDLSMFFYKDRTVSVGLTLDTEGRLTDVKVLESSQVPFFDRVVVAAFLAAQPFPNPPRGMFEGADATQFAYSVTLLAGDTRPRFHWRLPRQE